MLIIGHPAPFAGPAAGRCQPPRRLVRLPDVVRTNVASTSDFAPLSAILRDQERTGNGEEKSRCQAHHHPSVSPAPQAERIWTRYNAPGGLFPPDLTLVFPCHYTNRF